MFVCGVVMILLTPVRACEMKYKLDEDEMILRVCMCMCTSVCVF